jgi:ACS family D-galactonate transporter-like MFS transporter
LSAIFPPKSTHARFAILALLAMAVVINYLDRAIIGIAAPLIAHEYLISSITLGVVFSAFSWSYLAAQLPSGILIDRFGARIVYLIAIIGWSLSTLMHASITGFASLLGWRLSLGLFEAPCFPANNVIVGAWFPRAERARAVGVYTAAEYVALGFATPLLFWILNSAGWRALFFISGGAGVLFTFFWWAFYRDPEQSRRLGDDERKLIRDGGGRPSSGGNKFDAAAFRQLVCNRQILALCLGQFAVYSTFTFFLTWFPTYLATARHMGWIKIGLYASLPYLAGFFGILFAGWLSDFLLRRGASLNLARKLPVVAGLLLASTIVLANYAQSNALVVLILSVAFFAQAMSSSGWAVLPEIAPEGTLGLVGGLFSSAANVSGIVTPLVIGIIIQKTGSFVWALGFVGGVAALGALAWIFLIGDLKPIRLDPVP